jgi:GDPmannose 4,6-dehydratase
MNKVALITGITGQDGSYLAEQLIAKGYEVHGLLRRASTFNTARIESLYRSPEMDQRIFLHYADSADALHLYHVIRDITPNEIYNLAALSHVAQSFDQPEYATETAGLGLLKILETLKLTKVPAKVYQASTSELFGATPPPQNENSKFNPRSPYAVAKLFAHETARLYREAYGIFVSTGILFNHESPRRGRAFVTRKITSAVAEIKKGKRSHLVLGNQKALRDWGYAPEYTDAMWRILQLSEPQDLVVATGTQHSVSEFCDFAFSSVGLDWREFTSSSSQFERPLEVESLCGDPARMFAATGWKAQTFAPEIARIMVQADMERNFYQY